MAVVHISEAEAVRDFAAVMNRVRCGAEVVIETEDHSIAVLRKMETRPVRLLSESLRLAAESTSKATLDGGFGSDLEAVIDSHREPLDSSAWD